MDGDWRAPGRSVSPFDDFDGAGIVSPFLSYSL